MSEAELRLPSDVAYVYLARLVVAAAARQSGMDEARLEDLKIAVSEATTNAIRAHQAADSDRPVVLNFGPSDGQFHVTVQDTGAGFDSSAVAPPSTSELTEGGLGVVLIRGLTDDVDFVQAEGMTVNMRFAVNLANAVA